MATGRTPAAWSAGVGGRVDCGRPLLATPQNARHRPQGALQPTCSWGTAIVFTSQGLLRRCEPWAAPVTRALACHPVPVGVASAAKVCPKEKRRWSLVVWQPRRKNEGGAGQNFLKMTQNNLRKAKRRSNEGPAKENPGLRDPDSNSCLCSLCVHCICTDETLRVETGLREQYTRESQHVLHLSHNPSPLSRIDSSHPRQPRPNNTNEPPT